MPNKPIAYYHNRCQILSNSNLKSHMTHTLDLDLLSLKLDSQLLQLNSISKTEPHTAIFNTTTPLHISTYARLAQPLTIVAKVHSLGCRPLLTRLFGTNLSLSYQFNNVGM